MDLKLQINDFNKLLETKNIDVEKNYIVPYNFCFNLIQNDFHFINSIMIKPFDENDEIIINNNYINITLEDTIIFEKNNDIKISKDDYTNYDINLPSPIFYKFHKLKFKFNSNTSNYNLYNLRVKGILFNNFDTIINPNLRYIYRYNMINNSINICIHNNLSGIEENYIENNNNINLFHNKELINEKVIYDDDNIYNLIIIDYNFEYTSLHNMLNNLYICNNEMIKQNNFSVLNNNDIIFNDYLFGINICETVYSPYITKQNSNKLSLKYEFFVNHYKTNFIYSIKINNIIQYFKDLEIINLNVIKNNIIIYTTEININNINNLIKLNNIKIKASDIFDIEIICDEIYLNYLKLLNFKIGCSFLI